MNAIFSPDSKLMGGLSLLADMIVVNCLYLLCCIPIFTIGAARVALYCVGMCWARRESAGVKKYISVFISSIKSTFALFLSDSITALIHFHGQFYRLLFVCDIHIIPNNAQGGIIALALKNSAAHFLRLFLHSILPECL